MNSPIVKFFSDEEMEALREEMGVELGDLVMFAVADRKSADEILGGMRLHMAGALELPREGHDFLWVVNFPLFHWDDEAKRYEAEHQPFTLPTELDVEKIKADPLAVGSATYDFVMDGCEAGGGGMRIHNSQMQLDMLELMGFTQERAREQFGFLMDALEYGAPPMGGFALGLDRVRACCWPARTPSATSWRSQDELRQRPPGVRGSERGLLPGSLAESVCAWVQRRRQERLIRARLCACAAQQARLHGARRPPGVATPRGGHMSGGTTPRRRRSS